MDVGNRCRRRRHRISNPVQRAPWTRRGLPARTLGRGCPDAERNYRAPRLSTRARHHGNRRGLALRRAPRAPTQARPCLNESPGRSVPLGYENQNNPVPALLLPPRADDPPATLEMASHTIRHLHWARQGPWLTASLNVVARVL